LVFLTAIAVIFGPRIMIPSIRDCPRQEGLQRQAVIFFSFSKTFSFQAKPT